MRLNVDCQTCGMTGEQPQRMIASRPLRRLRSMCRDATERQLSGAGAPVRRYRLPLSTPSHNLPFPPFLTEPAIPTSSPQQLAWADDHWLM